MAHPSRKPGHDPSATSAERRAREQPGMRPEHRRPSGGKRATLGEQPPGQEADEG